MPLFMFVSGYVYWATWKPVKYMDFVLKKFKRLMMPYFLVSILIISIKMISESSLHVENPVTWLAYLKMFYIPSAGYFLWFAYALFLAFLIIPFFHTDKRLNILFVVALVFLLTPFSVTRLFCLEELRKHLFYFVLGCIISREENIRLLFNKFHPFLLMALCICVYWLKFGLRFTQGVTISLFLALAGVVFILSLSRYINGRTTVVKRFFINLSVYSYTVYLLHTTFEGFAKAVLVKIPIDADDGLMFCVSASIVILAGVLAPVVVSLLLKRLKIMLYI
jgi:hypothetical protein